MLTAFQASTGAYMTEDGELLCESCFESEDLYAKPISNYGLDEWQTANAEGYDWSYEDGRALRDEDLDPEDRGVDLNELHAECEPALYDLNGHELVEAYHEHPDVTDGIEHPHGAIAFE